MKIYYICAVDISNFDAQRTHILEVVKEMKKAGEDVTLFLPQFQKEREALPFKTKYIPLLFRKSRNLKFLEYEIRLFFVLKINCLFKRPEIIFVRKGFLTLAPLLLARTLCIKSIVEINGIISDEIKLAFGLPDFVVRIFALIEKMSCRWANKVVVVTEGLKNYLINNYQISQSKVEIIPNGVNTEHFLPRIKASSETFCLGFVGNLVQWAGVEIFIKSIPSVVQNIQNIRYLIIGDGLLRESLEQLTHSLKIDGYVNFVGKVEPGKVPEYINKCDICFIPAVKERNLTIGISPLKLYEYLACGKPVIVSDIKGLDIVEDLKVGLVVEPDSAEQLTQATLKLLNDSAERQRMGERARQAAVERFSWTNTTNKILLICKNLIRS